MAEIADADLPVFPFRVNWKSGISERLEWKTDVLRDLVGNEQRQGLRLTPRRDFEVTLTVWDQERSFLELWLQRMIGTEFLFPVWHDSVRAAQEAAAGQKTIWVDTRDLEFGIGSYGLLRGPTALAWERFEIAEVHDDHIVTVENLVNDWPKGTRVEPLIRGRMSDQTRTNLASSRAGETQAVFEATRAQPFDEGVDSADQYLGLPVLTAKPNRSDGLDVQHLWDFHESDSGTGRRYRTTETDRAIIAQKHSWFLHGRSAKGSFRSLLYRLKGALKPVWLPTFNEDMVLAQDAAPAASTIYIEAIGFGYTGGPSSGREHVMIETTSGRIYRKVTGTASAPAGQERLVLSASLPTGLLRKNVRRISWMDTARLQNDRIEFDHINAADGLSKVASIFQTYRNERTAPAILSAPIPHADKGNGPCGDDVVLCYPVPSLAVFEGWYYKTVISLPTNTPELGGANMIHTLTGTIGGYGNVGFLRGTDGEFIPGPDVRAQAHVMNNNTLVISYFTDTPEERGPPIEAFIQLQRAGGSSDPESNHNSITIQRWDGEPVSLGGFSGAGLFPERYRKAIPPL